MKRKIFTSMLFVACLFTAIGNDISLVYTLENTGATCEAPPLPTVDQLPSIVRLPSPFEWSDGSGSIASFDDWTCRRAEIKAEIENYEIGKKPERPNNITATYSNKTLTVTINENGKTLTLTSNVTIPTGDGPFPVIIGMNSGTGSLSASHFNGCIQIPFNHNQVATYSMSGQKDLSAPFYQMYPELSNVGDYSAWPWGVSRLIDGLEIVQAEMNANLERIAVTGCSYAGKMALFAGAFDERIALTIAQEPGGGGSASWRVSETIGEVEKISNTNYSWFMPALKTNFDGRVEKLPYDHHELMAMVAPRALLVLGNDGWTWLADESGYVACMAAREVWKFMGIEDRFGFDFTGGHQHCQACESQNNAVANFVDKFLRGNSSVNTNITTNPYANVNYQFWISDWSNVSEPVVDLEQYWYEAESDNCATIGSDFEIIADNEASNGKYVTVKTGLSSTDSAPDEAGMISIPFTAKNHGKYHIYFRLNCADNTNDPFWLKINNGTFKKCDGLSTNGVWQWVSVESADLLAGNHILTIAYCENGAKLDKIYITNDDSKIPSGMGEEETGCETLPSCVILDFESGNINGWTKQNPGAGIDITQDDKHSGAYALKIVNGSGTDAWSVQAFSPAVDIVPKHTYNVSFWIRAVGGGGKGRISTVSGNQLGNQYWSDFNVDDTWKQVTYTNLVAAGSTVRLAFDMGYVANKTYYIDDIVFEDITADAIPQLHVQNTEWNAGEVQVNESSQSELFSIRNIGTGILNISEFTNLSAPWTTSLEPESSISLKAGQVREFTFTYAPISASESIIDFAIKTNAGDAVINLTGKGIAGSNINNAEILGIKIFSSTPGKINVTAPENSGMNVIDILGKKVFAQNIDSSPLEISLNSGVYFIHIKNEKNIHTQKVIVK